ncbi:unnamed protein product [Oikopleura dioica]|uniref:Uncharacterized protein n=1 Tax=Oikopleura dioica TaxID=34765 RepID=E4XGT7_OIKDI|nr:unnamed protein product [Oikopleura dioica]
MGQIETNANLFTQLYLKLKAEQDPAAQGDKTRRSSSSEFEKESEKVNDVIIPPALEDMDKYDDDLLIPETARAKAIEAMTKRNVEKRRTTMGDDWAAQQQRTFSKRADNSQPRFLTFYLSIILVLSSLAAFSTVSHHLNTTKSICGNLSVVESMDPSTESCYAVTCIAFTSSSYLLSIIVAIFGIEGSRRASSDQKTSRILFWFHHCLGTLSFLALILSLIFMTSNVLQVCAGLYSSGLTFVIILIGTCLSLLLLFLSLMSGFKTRQNLRSIEYRHATFY